jgi:hypothetical protein
MTLLTTVSISTPDLIGWRRRRTAFLAMRLAKDAKFETSDEGVSIALSLGGYLSRPKPDISDPDIASQ